MKRGDIITIADPSGDFSRKPRPALIIQGDGFLTDHASVIVCLITSYLTGLLLFRIPLPAGAETGLVVPSEVEVDKLQAVWRHRIGKHIGQVAPETMTDIDHALRRWLAL